MIRGIYISTSGMDVQQARIESVTNNLANASTPGYKRETVLFQSFPERLLIEQGGPARRGSQTGAGVSREIGVMGTGAMVKGIITDFRPGNVQVTGNDTDIMINGPGFFALNATAPGEPDRVCYTRSGMFKIDQEGYLALNGSYRALGQSGEIHINGGEFSVAPDGTILVGGSEVDRLRLVEFDDPNSLDKVEDGIFADVQGSGRQAVETTLAQGYLEMSNVNTVEEMADLIALMRVYEANQRLIQSYDEILSKAVNQVGSLR